MEEGRLDGKVALITGASKGIGKAVAVALAKEGCSVVINYKSDTEAANAVLEECNQYSAGNKLIAGDVSSEEEVVQMFKEIPALDILINNAGIYDENDGIDNLEVFQSVFKNNFFSAVFVTKYALERMEKGKIINISSIHGRLGYGRPSAAAYASSKAALENYTMNVAKECAPNILVNAIAPGRVATPMWDNPDEKEQLELGQAHLIKRMIQPEEIADAVVFLVKNDAMCGEVLTIDGGMSLVTKG